MEINRALRGLPTLGRRVGTLGEIVNPAAISPACGRQAQSFSILFRLPAAAGISTFYQIVAFPPNNLILTINSCVGLGSR